MSSLFFSNVETLEAFSINEEPKFKKRKSSTRRNFDLLEKKKKKWNEEVIKGGTRQWCLPH